MQLQRLSNHPPIHIFHIDHNTTVNLETNGYVKFGGRGKQGLCENGEWPMKIVIQ